MSWFVKLSNIFNIKHAKDKQPWFVIDMLICWLLAITCQYVVARHRCVGLHGSAPMLLPRGMGLPGRCRVVRPGFSAPVFPRMRRSPLLSDDLQPWFTSEGSVLTKDPRDHYCWYLLISSWLSWCCSVKWSTLLPLLLLQSWDLTDELLTSQLHQQSWRSTKGCWNEHLKSSQHVKC